MNQNEQPDEYPTPGPEEETFCRVCGYDGNTLFWEGGWPTAEICPCCGHESDVGDGNLEYIRTIRGEWVGQGATWNSPRYKPKDWELLKQIARLPTEWR